METVSEADAQTYTLRTLLILQKIMQIGKEIIFYEGQNRFNFLNDAYLKATGKPSSTTRTVSEQASSTT